MILFHQTLMQKRREKSYLTSPFFLSIIAIINFSLKRFISFVLLGNPVYVLHPVSYTHLTLPTKA